MFKNLLFIIAMGFVIHADTIIQIENWNDIVSGVWTKDKSPYIFNEPLYNSSGQIQNLEIQAGVVVYWYAKEIQITKGFFNILGSENDSVIFIAKNIPLRSRLLVSRLLSSDSISINAQFVRFSNISIDCSNLNAANLTVSHCFFTGWQPIHGTINIKKLYKSLFENTSPYAIEMTGGKEYNISCCTFNNFNGVVLAGADKVVIDSCFLNGSNNMGLKFGDNNRVYIKNNIITNCADTSSNSNHGAGISLLYRNHYSEVINNIITNNITKEAGGGIASLASNDTLICIGNIIANNTAKINGGGGAFLQGKYSLLLNNTLVNNSEGILISYNPLLAINNIIAHNGNAFDSIQVCFGDTVCISSNFYNCCLEFGINKFKLVKNDSGKHPYSGIARGIISSYPDLISRTISNPFGYSSALPVFPTSISNTNNQGILNPYLTTLSTRDIIGTSWTKDDSVDIGAIQYNQDIVAANKSILTIHKVENNNYRKCDLLGRSIDKEFSNKLVIRNNNKQIILK